MKKALILSMLFAILSLGCKESNSTTALIQSDYTYDKYTIQNDTNWTEILDKEPVEIPCLNYSLNLEQIPIFIDTYQKYASLLDIKNWKNTDCYDESKLGVNLSQNSIAGSIFFGGNDAIYNSKMYISKDSSKIVNIVECYIGRYQNLRDFPRIFKFNKINNVNSFVLDTIRILD